MVTAAVWGELENPKSHTIGGTQPPPASDWFNRELVFGTMADIVCKRLPVVLFCRGQGSN